MNTTMYILQIIEIIANLMTQDNTLKENNTL